MKIISWNINGIRSLKPGVKEILNNLDSDIVCFQETKLSRIQLEETTALIDGYTSYFSFPHYISGYSGVATYCRNSCRPIHAEEGLLGTLSADNFDRSSLKNDFHLSELQQLDNEGRVLITEHIVRCETEVKLVVINVYCPRADPDRPERKEYKLKFYQLIKYRTEEYLKQDYHVLIVGDINTAHKLIDHCDPGNIGEFAEEPARKWLDCFLCKTTSLLENIEAEKGGVMVDTFRYFNPTQKDAYTCWNTKTNARMTNYGTRIDYILTNIAFLPFVKDSIILPEVQGSDHCPVAALLHCTPVPAKQSPKICTRNWSEFAGKQQTLLGFLQSYCTELEEKVEYRKNCSSASFRSYKKQGIKTQKAITQFLAINKRLKSECSEDAEHDDIKQRKLDSESTSGFLDHTSLKQSIQFECQSAAFSSDGSNSVPLEHSKHKDLCVHSLKLTSSFCSKDQIYKHMFDKESRKNINLEQKQIWKMLLSGPPPPPLCKGHKEPCILRTVKKEGRNNGRQFYVCAKPNGHPSNPNARCDHFEWVRNSKQMLQNS